MHESFEAKILYFPLNNISPLNFVSIIHHYHSSKVYAQCFDSKLPIPKCTGRVLVTRERDKKKKRNQLSNTRVIRRVFALNVSQSVSQDECSRGKRERARIDWFARSLYFTASRERNKKQRACLVFPFLWTLDPLSQGFNFWPLRAAPSFFSVFRFLPRHRESCQTYSTLVRDNASSSLRDKAMHNATAIRSRAPVSGYSASVPLSATRFLFLTFPLPSPLFFFPPFFFFFFLPFLLCSSIYFSPLFIQSSVEHVCSMGQTAWKGQITGDSLLLPFRSVSLGDFTSLRWDKRLLEEAGRWLGDEEYIFCNGGDGHLGENSKNCGTSCIPGVASRDA